MLYYTKFSLSESSAEVASSNINIDGLFIKALAMAMRYNWPPESLIPLSPTIVSKPSGKFFLSLMKTSHPAILQTSKIYSSVYSISTPYIILYLRLELNKTGN